MRKSYGEGVANHTVPKESVPKRESGKHEIRGGYAGEVLSRENVAKSESRRCCNMRKVTLVESTTRDSIGLCAVVDPEHVWKCLTRNLGEPMFIQRFDGPTGSWREAMSERRRRTDMGSRMVP